jgi:hypothetical protein
MTKKRYAKKPGLSRSRTPDDETGAFEALRPPTGEHPVDARVDRLPPVARRRRVVPRQETKVSARIRHVADFVAYQDLRLQLESERETAYYDIGYANGAAMARAESLAGRARWNARATSFSRHVLVATKRLELSQRQSALVLLELAHALVMGIPRTGG